MLNRLIIWVSENDLRDVFYNLAGQIPHIISFPFSLWLGKKIHIPFYKSIILYWMEVYLLGYIMQFVMWMNTGFKTAGGVNIAVAFTYIPLIALLGSKLLRLPYDSVCQFMVFPPIFNYAIGRWGCVFFGCCHGYSCDWGIYNPRLDQYVFPVAVLESFVAIVLCIWMFCEIRKRKYVPDGNMLPKLLIVYGTLRFFIEFLHDNEKVLFGCSKLAFHALFMVLIGTILLTVKLRKNNIE